MDPNLVSEEYLAGIRGDLAYACLDTENVEDGEVGGQKRRLTEDAASRLWWARREFFLTAREQGLNAHQALHSWSEAVERDLANLTYLNGGEFCNRWLAQALGVTPETLREADPLVIAFAIQEKLTLTQAQEIADRERSRGLN